MIAKLQAVLGLDGKNFKAGVKGAKAEVSSFEKQLGGLKRTMAGAFSVAAIGTLTNKIIDFASEIRHTADNLNVTTDFLQAVNARALTYGVSLENVSMAMSKLAIAQGRVSDGDKTMTDAFNALGMSMQDVADMGTEELLLEIGRAFGEAKDQAQAMNAVAEILGVRVGPRLFAMLKDIGGEGMDALIDGAKRAGDVMDEELITKMELLGTRMDQLKMRSSIGFASAADKVASYTEAVATFWGSIFGGAGVGGAVGNVADLINQPMIDQIERETEKARERAEKARQKRDADAAKQQLNNTQESANMQADAHVQAWLRHLEKLDKEKERMAEKDAERQAKIAQDIADIRAGKGASLDSIEADSYARIGGRIGRDVDPQLRILDRQLQIQKNMETYLREIKDNGGLA